MSMLVNNGFRKEKLLQRVIMSLSKTIFNKIPSLGDFKIRSHTLAQLVLHKICIGEIAICAYNC